MNSLLKKHKLLLLLFLAGALVLFNLHAVGMRGAISAALSPMQASLWQAGRASSAFLAGIFQGAGLKERVLKLEAENLLLTQKLLSLQEAEKENERLAEALGTQRQGFDLLLTDIVGKETERDVLVLNKGSAEGVKQGMPVITQSRVAAGSIGEVFEHTSKVQLLSLKDSSSDVRIQGKETVGVLKGQGRFKARLDLIPKEGELKKGDLLVTSALGGVFPDNLLVGEVATVEKSDLTAFQGGSVELFFHVRKENSLFILKNKP